jgi:hypothetical protein
MRASAGVAAAVASIRKLRRECVMTKAFRMIEFIPP